MPELLENVATRYIKCSQKGSISYTDELNILEYLVERFKLKTITQYAKSEKITYPGAQKRVVDRKVMSIILGNIVFVIP